MVTLGCLKAKVLHGKLTASDSVDKAAYTVFERVTAETSLKELNRILHQEHFALVVDSFCPSEYISHSPQKMNFSNVSFQTPPGRSRASSQTSTSSTLCP